MNGVGLLAFQSRARRYVPVGATLSVSPELVRLITCSASINPSTSTSDEGEKGDETDVGGLFCVLTVVREPPVVGGSQRFGVDVTGVLAESK